MKRFFLFILVLLATRVNAETVSLRYSANSGYYIVERSNWSQYVNGKYIGLTHRETRASLTAADQTEGGIRFSGFFYLLEETRKDMTKSARSLDEMIPSEFIVGPAGSLRFITDAGFPQFRDFPAYPDDPVRPGDRWQCAGYRSVDPKNDGHRSLLPILVEYRFVGSEKYRDKNVYRITAKFATRMDAYRKNKTDDPSLAKAMGTHDAEILVDAETGAVILILDRMDETFYYADGDVIRFKGNTAIFSEIPIVSVRTTLLPEIASLAKSAPESIGLTSKPVDDLFGDSPIPDGDSASRPPTKRVSELPQSEPEETAAEHAFKVEDTPQGVRLSVRDLRFKADSDTILPEEEWRLDAIASALALVPDGHFLVEGHTAAVGKPTGEKELSVKRAKKIVDELSTRGVSAERFIYTGYGGTRPIADNSTADGRAQNRRVEITIME